MEYSNGSENNERKNNNGRKNNYNNNGRNNRNTDYRANSRNNDYNEKYVIEYDARRTTRKPDFAVKDKYGKLIVINGDFETGFLTDVPDWKSKIELVRRSEEIKESNDIDEVAELMRAVYSIVIGLLNQNIYGDEYTIRDIKRGFPSHDDLWGIIEVVTDKLHAE